MKALERVGKFVFAALMAALLWRRRRAVPAGRLKVLVVRLDNRVGEALLTTALFDALAAAGHEVHTLAHEKTRRVLQGHPSVARVWTWRRSFSVLAELRAQRFDVVFNCGNWAEAAVTSAVVSRLVARDGVCVGPANAPSRWLMDVAVPPLAGTTSELRQRTHLGSVLVDVPTQPQLSFRATPEFSVVEGAYAVINPGGRLGWRRVPVDAFAAAAQTLTERGVTPVVVFGPGEDALAGEVCRACPQAVRAPPTDIEQLASLLRGAVLCVTNNTGPMHLAVAVGCPTLALFLSMETERWGHSDAPHRVVDLTGVNDRVAVVRDAVVQVLGLDFLRSPRGLAPPKPPVPRGA